MKCYRIFYTFLLKTSELKYRRSAIMEEQQPLLPSKTEIPTSTANDCSCDEWCDGSSCSSYYSDSDSTVPEWDSSINTTGELLFIDCDPVVSHTSSQQEPETADFSTKNQTRHSTRSRFLKILRRRDSKRRSKRFLKNQAVSSSNQDTNKVKFQDHEEGEIREVVLKIDQENRKLGRRATVVESLLGLTVSTLSDGTRVMIAGFIPDTDAAKQKNIKIGDWLKSINHMELTFQNLNAVLEQIGTETEVTLKLQRVAGIEVTKNPPINELSNQSNFVQQLTNVRTDEASVLSSMLCEHPVGIIYINTESLTETGPEFEGLAYCYPQPYEKNQLCTSRGVFITLNHLLSEITQSKPQVTSVVCNNRLSYIVYTSFGNKLLLFMLPGNRASTKEVVLINNEVIRMLEFTYQTIDRCFETPSHKDQLDHFFSRFFARLLSSGLWPKAEQRVELVNLTSKAQQQSPFQFEDVLPVAHSLTLPDEAQMQIDDALTDLEASDYREWNEDPLDCQRLFTILGSALYHSGYLLASHLVHGDLIDVHIFCRQQGLFHLSRTEPVRSLVLWREVFPSSCNGGLESESSLFVVPNGRRYLLIVGSAKDLLAVLMEAGGCTEPPEDNLGPDAFYVEEAQATLAHLQDLGISNLASRWIATNPGSQVTIPEIPVKRKTDFLGNISFAKSTSPNTLRDPTSPIQKKPEVTSILKRRSSDQGLFPGSGSTFSLVDDNSEIQSEDSMSQGGYSERSEVSDEPVLGRRAIREKRNYLESDEEDSDIEDYRDGSQSNSSYDLSELRQSLLAETAEKKPNRLTAGAENVLFHYVQLDSTEGLLLCPPQCQMNSTTLEVVLSNFRKCAQHIHHLFQNTLRFKSMLAQDMAKSVINKSLIAIKEYGTLFECSFADDTSRKFGKLTYWVIGRLFYVPQPREVYICYQDSIPQNIIEIAFKLGVTTG